MLRKPCKVRRSIPSQALLGRQRETERMDPQGPMGSQRRVTFGRGMVEAARVDARLEETDPHGHRMQEVLRLSR